jgi:MFS family permease
MKPFRKSKWLSWLPQINPQVWILSFGRFLSSIGSGFTLFYAPIFFVNQVGLSATSVGIALGSASISGVIGRILSGSFSDSRFWGRRRTLLLSTVISAIASFVLSATNNFNNLVIGNLLVGLGQGLYWPATEAVVADLTSSEQRSEAYAITRLADNIGLGLGIVFGGVLIGISSAYRTLFVIDGISFLVFFGVIYFAIAETYQPAKTAETGSSVENNWITALRDRRLLVYILVNIIFTTYISQLQSTLPLYLKNFVSNGESHKGFAETTISILFGWRIALSIFCQLPIARSLKRFTHPQVLTISAVIWAVGFILIWVTGVTPFGSIIWATLAMGVLAIAIVSYTPSASALVTDLASESQRGVYLSMNSLCWAIGYLIGPPLGGWALDQQRWVTSSFWLGLAFSVVITIAILQYLNSILDSK